jgi:predicted P-loop ATPase
MSAVPIPMPDQADVLALREIIAQAEADLKRAEVEALRTGQYGTPADGDAARAARDDARVYVKGLRELLPATAPAHVFGSVPPVPTGTMAPPHAAAVSLATAMPTPLTVIHNGLLRTNLRYDPIADEENVRLLLEREPNLQGIARFNEFSGELILVRPVTSDPGLVGERGLPRPWTDTDTATLQTFIQKHYIPKIAREKIDAIVSMHARQRSAFHPVRDYLQSISWDGTPRLDTWMRDYWGAAKQPAEYLAAVGAAWMISAVARIMEPGCQADYALVLEGDQGVRKSSALRILAGDDYFSDSLPADLSHKDARDHLRGKWIVELPELAQFKRNEIETVKAFITRRYEQYRPSYGRHEVRFPRQCVFAGSTNDETYLVDTTGNRRFWVLACAGVDLEAIKRDRDQLWAEAAARYRKGERWYLTQEQEALAAVEAAARVAHDPWTAQVVRIVTESLKGPDVSPGEVMEYMSLPATERHARNAARVGSVLMNLSWKRDKRDRTRGQLYARPGTPLKFVSPLTQRAPPPPQGVKL